jgi:hypothetical protein
MGSIDVHQRSSRPVTLSRPVHVMITERGIISAFIGDRILRAARAKSVVRGNFA